MIKFLTFFLTLSLCSITPLSFAQEAIVVKENTNQDTLEKPAVSLPKVQSPQVGKHAMANMDAGSMILSLLMVLALIIISALVLKRFNLAQKSSNQLRVIASLSLGAKERVVVVQIGEQQLVLGICPQQITLLKQLDNPIDVQVSKSLTLPGNVLSFLQTNSIKTNVETKVSASETTNTK